jgi:hypothetical protein
MNVPNLELSSKTMHRIREDVGTGGSLANFSADVGRFNRQLLKGLGTSQKIYLSSSRLNGEFAVRICILGFHTHGHEVKNAFEVIKSTAQKLEAGA